MRRFYLIIAVMAGWMIAAAPPYSPMPVWAHSGAMGIVKERMDAMEEVGKAMKAMAKMIKGEAEFDTAEIARNSKIIHDRSGPALTKLFPADSLQKPSEATPAIWDQWPRFEELSDDLMTHADMLSVAASKEAAKAAFGQLGSTCKACHESFRIKKE